MNILETSLLTANERQLVQKFCTKQQKVSDKSSLSVSGIDEIDQELSIFIALSVRDFLHSWHSQITTCTDFQDETVQAIQLCLAQLWPRIDSLNLAEILFIALPAVLLRHIREIRYCEDAEKTLLAQGLSTEKLYLQRNFHFGTSQTSNSRSNQIIYHRLLSDRIIEHILPLEHLVSDSERCFLREILASVVFDKIIELSKHLMSNFRDEVAKLNAFDDSSKLIGNSPIIDGQKGTQLNDNFKTQYDKTKDSQPVIKTRESTYNRFMSNVQLFTRTIRFLYSNRAIFVALFLSEWPLLLAEFLEIPFLAQLHRLCSFIVGRRRKGFYKFSDGFQRRLILKGIQSLRHAVWPDLKPFNNFKLERSAPDLPSRTNARSLQKEAAISEQKTERKEEESSNDVVLLLQQEQDKFYLSDSQFLWLNSLIALHNCIHFRKIPWSTQELLNPFQYDICNLYIVYIFIDITVLRVFPELCVF